MRQEESHQNRRLIFSLVLFGLLAADLIVKQWAMQQSKIVWNEGGVWGILPGKWWVPLAAVMTAGLFFGSHRANKVNLADFGLILIAAGGLGNLADRIVFGAVRDFIYYPGLQVYGNLADIFLGLGIIWFIWFELAKGRTCRL